MGDVLHQMNAGNVFFHCPGCKCAHRVANCLQPKFELALLIGLGQLHQAAEVALADARREAHLDRRCGVFQIFDDEAEALASFG